MYYRFETTADDGRALIGKFSDSFHGCQGRSSASNLISSVTDNVSVSQLILFLNGVI